MNFIRCNLREYDSIAIVPLGDVHYGAKIEIEKYYNYIKFVKENKNAFVFLMGDMIDVSQKNSPGSSFFDQQCSPQDQVEWLVNTISPIRDRIICYHEGNHEKRIFKNSGVNITKNVCRELKIQYVEYSAFTRINLKKVSYSIFSTHGNSGAKLPHTKMNIIYNLTRYIHGVDIYMMGHVHSKNWSKTIIKKPDLKNHITKDEEAYYILTGHFLGYDNSYAEGAMLQPEETGTVLITLDGLKKNIVVEY